ncbi:hypothetical protein [Nocardia implantans]|uniref:Uncharacterized protein n=1 Tax=Nocardia implantans TaxID=3108168 RepID=A0ABU6AZG4_9NOCA|nr:MULTISPECIES: hypothetical protein [unclassified Nocardia]MBF6194075.1 hypothetical protein [Nocardia beijingensis]MEA3529682.1 hypothetical protein [Nocardia sp. CDC192]MEB3512840.1 hypothetical protein [Nocardia sp. CDC186]
MSPGAGPWVPVCGRVSALKGQPEPKTMCSRAVTASTLAIAAADPLSAVS